MLCLQACNVTHFFFPPPSLVFSFLLFLLSPTLSSPPLHPLSIMSQQPYAVCGLAYDLVQRLSPIVRQIDFALDWMELEAGRALYKYECAEL